MDTKVLLIDDEARIRQTFARSLKLAGYTVITADNGEAGLARFAEAQPDLVLLDLRMPGMDGLTVLEAIRARDPEANVILTTGHGDTDAVIAALRAGASDFLPKPIDQVTLESALRRAEERLHLKRELRASQEALRQQNARLEELVKARTVALEREIEERKQAHAALQEREIKLRAILDATTAAVVLLDAEGTVLDANQVYPARFGLTRDALIGRNVWELFSPDVVANRQALVERVFATKQAIRTEDERDGVWNDYVIYPVHDAQGQVTSVAVYAQDITQRKHAEGNFRSYIKHAPYGVFIANQQGQYLEVNPAASTITGYTQKELLGMGFMDLIPPQERSTAAEHFRRVNDVGQASGELHFQHKDGSTRYWSVEAVKLSATRFMGFVQDITERRQAAEERELYLSELEFINTVIIEISRMRNISAISTYIADKVQAVNEKAVVTVSVYETATEAIQVKAITGISHLVEKLVDILGFSPMEVSIRRDQMISNTQHYTSGKLEHVPGGLYAILEGKVPEAVCGLVERTFGLSEVYVVGFALDDQPFGGITLFLPKGHAPKLGHAIETIASHVSLLINRLIAEQALQKHIETA